MKLSDVKVKNAKPKAKPYKIADGGGLFLLVTPAGGKLWRWKYRVEGSEKLMTLGAYPEVALLEVRERHTQARKGLHAGFDPMAKRKEQKVAAAKSAINSFESVARAWHKHWGKGKDAANTGRCLRSMEANLFPVLGAIPSRKSSLRPSWPS